MLVSLDYLKTVFQLKKLRFAQKYRWITVLVILFIQRQYLDYLGYDLHRRNIGLRRLHLHRSIEK
jgi:hypothetical protein